MCFLLVNVFTIFKVIKIFSRSFSKLQRSREDHTLNLISLSHILGNLSIPKTDLQDKILKQ